jgi:hypothetical protein
MSEALERRATINRMKHEVTLRRLGMREKLDVALRYTVPTLERGIAACDAELELLREAEYVNEARLADETES